MTLAFSPFQEIVGLAARHAPEDGEFATAIEKLTLFRRSRPTRATHTSYMPCFGFVLQGAKSVSLGADVFNYGAGHYLLTSLDLPVVANVTEASPECPHLCMGMAVDAAVLADLLKRIDLPRTASSDGMRGMAVTVAPPDLMDALTRLMRLLDRPEEIKAMAPLIEQEILYRILTGPEGPRLLHFVMAGSQSNRIARAVAWLKQNFAEPLRVEDLAARVGMSVSSFHHQFKSVTAMTPVQYQKQLRLFEARRLMVFDGVDVSTAGYSVGYQSPSQFSRDFARFYGHPPRKEIQAALAS